MHRTPAFGLLVQPVHLPIATTARSNPSLSHVRRALLVVLVAVFAVIAVLDGGGLVTERASGAPVTIDGSPRSAGSDNTSRTSPSRRKDRSQAWSPARLHR